MTYNFSYIFVTASTLRLPLGAIQLFDYKIDIKCVFVNFNLILVDVSLFTCKWPRSVA